MKKILNIIMFFLATAIVFTACKKDDKTPVLDITATVNPTWVKAPAPDTHYVLVQDSADVVLADFEWTEVVYAISDLPAPLYTLQLLFTEVDSTGTNWGETVDLFTTSEKMISLTEGTLNKNIIGEIGSDFSEDTVITIGFRLKANVNANDVSSYVDAFSEIVTVTATPYKSGGADVPGMYVPGAYQGWSPDVAPQIWDTDGDGKFEGYVYFPEVATFDGNFKFTANPEWVDDENYGSDGTEFGLDTDSGAGNLVVPGPGGYWLTCDVENLVWSYEAQDFGVIGSGILNGDWTEDVNMVATEAPFNVIEVTMDVTASQDAGELRFKYRMNDAWDVNYGADVDSDVLVNGGDDILMPEGAGNYTFKMDLSQPVFTYSFTKN